MECVLAVTSLLDEVMIASDVALGGLLDEVVVASDVVLGDLLDEVMIASDVALGGVAGEDGSDDMGSDGRKSLRRCPSEGPKVSTQAHKNIGVRCR